MDVPENLHSLIEETTNNAVGLVYSQPTQQQIVQDKQNYLISYIESLQKKDEHTNDNKKQKVNPFENPEKSLTVYKGNKYTILLNKFPVQKNHFLLITNEFIRQDALLDPTDLITVYKILKQLSKVKNTDSKTVAFFNSGSNSGASQAHKHIQFIRVDNDYKLFPDRVVAGKQFYVPNFQTPPMADQTKSYAHFIAPLHKDGDDDDVASDDLAMTYIALVQNCLTVIKDHHHLEGLEAPQTSSLSYNFIMTPDWLMLVPRSKETAATNGHFFNINSLGFLGLILTKNKDTYEKLVNNEFLIDTDILQKVGFPREYEKPDKEGDY